MKRDTNHEAAADGLAELIRIVRELRARCPWDREQTLASLGKHLIEEAYEAADAIAHGTTAAVTDELGDVVTQGLFAAIVAEETGAFTLDTMVAAAVQKLIRRHPHVYGDAQADTADEVVANWSAIKATERAAAGATSALDGVARGLPALMRAEKLGARAAGRDGLGRYPRGARQGARGDGRGRGRARAQRPRRGRRGARRHAARAGQRAALSRAQR